MSASALEAAYAKQAKEMCFASIMTASDGAIVQGKKCCNQRKGKKGAGVATASAGVGSKVYTTIKLTLSREALIKAVAVSLEAANVVLPPPLCTNPMLPLATTLTIFKITLDSDSMVPKDKE